MKFAIKINNDNGVEFWGPYESETLAKEVARAYVGITDSWQIIPAESVAFFDGQPF